MQKHKLEDYKVVRKIGEGAFGEILLVQLKNNQQTKQFAMKKISQKQILKVNKLHQPFIEREILQKFTTISPECFISLFETHSDAEYIYMILELCEGGSLQDLIENIDKIQNKKEVIRRIVVKIVLILEILRENNVLHRDLKPSNFLFHKNGTMKLADFGTALAGEDFFGKDIASKIAEYKSISEKNKKQKENEEQEEDFFEINKKKYRRSTFVGTAFYMPPQLLSDDYYGFQSELWGLGCIVFELIYKKSPFQDENEGMVWKKILHENVQIKKIEEFIPNSRQFINSLLKKDRFQRLGYGTDGFEKIKNHQFFEGINWEEERNKPIKEVGNYLTELEASQIEKTMNKEKILYSGVVEKKMFFGNYKERMLVLTSTPKLIYYDAQSGEKKGEIPLSSKTPFNLEGKNFSVTTEKKTYYYKSPKANQWVQMMNYAVVNKQY